MKVMKLSEQEPVSASVKRCCCKFAQGARRKGQSIASAWLIDGRACPRHYIVTWKGTVRG